MHTNTVTAPLRRAAASVYLKEKHGIERSPATLAKYASIGGGPEFRRAGRVPLYTPDALDKYAESILSKPVRSTSELRVAPRVAARAAE